MLSTHIFLLLSELFGGLISLTFGQIVGSGCYPVVFTEDRFLSLSPTQPVAVSVHPARAKGGHRLSARRSAAQGKQLLFG